jgi:hypothetical protein
MYLQLCVYIMYTLCIYYVYFVYTLCILSLNAYCLQIICYKFSVNSDSLQKKHKPGHTMRMELIVTYQGKEVLRTYVKEALFPLCTNLEQFYLGHMTDRLLLQDHPKLFSTYRGEF